MKKGLDLPTAFSTVFRLSSEVGGTEVVQSSTSISLSKDCNDISNLWKFEDGKINKTLFIDDWNNKSKTLTNFLWSKWGLLIEKLSINLNIQITWLY